MTRDNFLAQWGDAPPHYVADLDALLAATYRAGLERAATLLDARAKRLWSLRQTDLQNFIVTETEACASAIREEAK